jgi:hypothetical protein
VSTSHAPHSAPPFPLTARCGRARSDKCFRPHRPGQDAPATPNRSPSSREAVPCSWGAPARRSLGEGGSPRSAPHAPDSAPPFPLTARCGRARSDKCFRSHRPGQDAPATSSPRIASPLRRGSGRAWAQKTSPGFRGGHSIETDAAFRRPHPCDGSAATAPRPARPAAGPTRDRDQRPARRMSRLPFHR